MILHFYSHIIFELFLSYFYLRLRTERGMMNNLTKILNLILVIILKNFYETNN